MATFGERLRELRKEKQLTTVQLGELLGIANSSISRYENDLREPKADFIELASEFFDVSSDYLLGKSNDRNDSIDCDIRRIQRARDNMSTKDKEKMMKVLETMFEEYFD